MAAVSKLNFFGGFGDVIEETPSPTEAIILSSYFNNKIRRDERFLIDNSTFGFQEHQVPEEVWQAFPKWRLKYNDFDIWRRSDANDKTIMILAVDGRGTPAAKITVLARFIPQPCDMKKPRIKQSVSTLGEMKTRLAEEWEKVGVATIQVFPLVLLQLAITLSFSFLFFFSISYLLSLLRIELRSDAQLISLFLVSHTIGIYPSLLLAERCVKKIVKTKYFRSRNTPPIIRACNIHNAELAEAKARLEAS